MAALVNFWNSERGILALALILASSVLAGVSVITEVQWLDYTKWIFTTYVAGKTITGSVDIMAKSKVKVAQEQGPVAGGDL